MRKLRALGGVVRCIGAVSTWSQLGLRCFPKGWILPDAVLLTMSISEPEATDLIADMFRKFD